MRGGLGRQKDDVSHRELRAATHLPWTGRAAAKCIQHCQNGRRPDSRAGSTMGRTPDCE